MKRILFVFVGALTVVLIGLPFVQGRIALRSQEIGWSALIGEIQKDLELNGLMPSSADLGGSIKIATATKLSQLPYDVRKLISNNSIEMIGSVRVPRVGKAFYVVDLEPPQNGNKRRYYSYLVKPCGEFFCDFNPKNQILLDVDYIEPGRFIHKSEIVSRNGHKFRVRYSFSLNANDELVHAIVGVSALPITFWQTKAAQFNQQSAPYWRPKTIYQKNFVSNLDSFDF